MSSPIRIVCQPYIPSQEEVKLKELLETYHPTMWKRVVQSVNLDVIAANIPDFYYAEDAPISYYTQSDIVNGIRPPGQINYSPGEIGALLHGNDARRSVFDVDGTLCTEYSAIAFTDDVASHELTHGAHDLTELLFNLPNKFGEVPYIQSTEGIAEINGWNILLALDKESAAKREELVARYLGERIGMAYIISTSRSRKKFLSKQYYEGNATVTDIEALSPDVNQLLSPLALSESATHTTQRVADYIIAHKSEILQNPQYRRYIRQHVPHFIGTVKALQILQQGIHLSDLLFDPFKNTESASEYCHRIVKPKPTLEIPLTNNFQFVKSRGIVSLDIGADAAASDFWTVAQVKVTSGLYDNNNIAFNVSIRGCGQNSISTNSFFQVIPEDKERYDAIFSTKMNTFGARQVAEVQHAMLQRFLPPLYELTTKHAHAAAMTPNSSARNHGQHFTIEESRTLYAP